MRTIARDLVDMFLKLNVWLCLTSTLMVAASAIALSVPLTSVSYGALLPVFLFYFIYVEDRRRVGPEDPINHPRRTRLVRRYHDGLLLTEVAALAVYEAILISLVRPHSTSIALFLLGQVPFVILALYGRLKQRPLADSIAVGGTWAFVVTYSVLVSTIPRLSAPVAIVFLAWFFIVFAGVETRNSLDVEGDEAASKTTFAGLLGVRRTRAMEIALKSLGVVVFWYLAGPRPALIVVVYLSLLGLFGRVTRRRGEHHQ